MSCDVVSISRVQENPSECSWCRRTWPKHVVWFKWKNDPIEYDYCETCIVSYSAVQELDAYRDWLDSKNDS